jgi:hypothetical protein
MVELVKHAEFRPQSLRVQVPLSVFNMMSGRVVEGTGFENQHTC